MSSKRSPLLAHVVELENLSRDKDVSLSELVDIFGKEGHFVLILFLILPFLQPIALFGRWDIDFSILCSIIV